MRPEQQTTIPVDPHMHLSIWCNNNSKHFNCCYHDADDMNKFMQGFMTRLSRAYYVAFVIKAETEGVPRQ